VTGQRFEMGTQCPLALMMLKVEKVRLAVPEYLLVARTHLLFAVCLLGHLSPTSLAHLLVGEAN
jgi:hypothetical protein